MQSKFARTKTSYLNQTSWNTALCKMELQRMLPSNVVLTASGVQHLPLGLSAKFLVGTFTDMRLGVLSTAGRGVTGRGNGGTIPRARNHYGGAKSLWGAPNDSEGGALKNPKNVTSTFFITSHLLQKDLRFENGGVKLATCPGRHLTSLRPWRYDWKSTLVFVF